MWAYLNIEDVFLIHQLQLKRFGGAAGIRDENLLISAVMQAQLELFGSLVYPEIYQVAAIYAFHIIKNHPFVDGNKRTGIAVALTFLDLNTHRLDVSSAELYKFTMDIAASKMTKDDVIAYFKKYLVKN